MSLNTSGPNAQATNDDFEFEVLALAVNYRRALLEEFRPYLRGKVLEVGAGIGQFSRELSTVKEIDGIDAVEPDPRHYARLSTQGLPVRCFNAVASELDPQLTYDAIVSVNVLEHIEDHVEELKEYRKRLKPGGNLGLFVPAGRSIYAPIDKTFGHFRRYQKAELKDLLLRAGFGIKKLHYYNSLGFGAWWFNFCVLKKTGFEPAKVRVYDRYIFPVVHALESKGLRPPFGQSLLAVAGA